MVNIFKYTFSQRLNADAEMILRFVAQFNQYQIWWLFKC